MLDSFIVPYIQFVIMLMESEKALSLELKCLCSRTTTVLSEWTIPKRYGSESLTFYCIRNK